MSAELRIAFGRNRPAAADRKHMAVRISQLIAAFLFLALAAQPCLIAPVRKLWAKKRGSESKLFAFERNGRIGFIDPAGKVIIKPNDCRPY